ncbi:hypothetical protein GCM10007320_43310 [Pseudorhodoferax aquiterrae]|uniref:SnoaL-like domain-containing protein n=1 Tax=Pseudorhodoferax aquiterrae TaxID=747304 RepID=A0ABQ3G759_9BURK|nr:nuclear transport factor 2 family protein [Pseudorhodoferax aquiterrae]GHC92841.1 hypothetical protein GCM10007320_43310 [Pseudorhodoferax aquiterrae]
MTVNLPRSIAAYFEADRHGGPDAVAAAFTPDGVVKDEGKTHQGRDATRAWKAGTTQKYTYTMEPFAVATDEGQTQVTVQSQKTLHPQFLTRMIRSEWWFSRGTCKDPPQASRG